VRQQVEFAAIVHPVVAKELSWRTGSSVRSLLRWINLSSGSERLEHQRCAAPFGERQKDQPRLMTRTSRPHRCRPVDVRLEAGASAAGSSHHDPAMQRRRVRPDGPREADAHLAGGRSGQLTARVLAGQYAQAARGHAAGLPSRRVGKAGPDCFSPRKPAVSGARFDPRLATSIAREAGAELDAPTFRRRQWSVTTLLDLKRRPNGHLSKAAPAAESIA
jgi:hypothetical protein